MMIGSTGPSERGITGLTGNTGHTGAGAFGDIGPTGIISFTGSTGPIPVNYTGPTGIFSFDGLNESDYVNWTGTNWKTINDRVTLGGFAGYSSQSNNNPIAIGYYAGYNNQRGFGIAIGSVSAPQNQPLETIALAYRSGTDIRGATGQNITCGNECVTPFGGGSVNIGQFNVATNFGVALGVYAFSGNLNDSTVGNFGIAIGRSIARNYNVSANYFLAIGTQIGFTYGVGSWATGTIGIGTYAFRQGVPAYSIGIGYNAIYLPDYNQGHLNHIGIGYQVGYYIYGDNRDIVMIGRRAGYNYPQSYGIYIGYYAGKIGVVSSANLLPNSIAIGNSSAGVAGQGINSIAIGYYAGNSSKINNYSVVINASSSKTVVAGNTGFFVNPIRGTGGVAGGNSGANNVLTYNTNTSEITYSTEIDLFNLYLTGATAATGGIGNVNNTNNNVYCNNVYALTAVYANNVALTSDYRIKENVRALDNNFKVDYLNPVTYTNKQTNKQDIGLIAHELQEHYPELVTGVKDGPEIQSVNYIGLIPILINEIKIFKNYLKNLKEKWNKEFE
jgi:hypothetical protein